MTINLKEYALIGAKARLAELDRERELILRSFPALGSSPKGTKSAKPQRKRRRMTAAQRKAVGDRMKAYWAAKRVKGTAKK